MTGNTNSHFGVGALNLLFVCNPHVRTLSNTALQDCFQIKESSKMKCDRWTQGRVCMHCAHFFTNTMICPNLDHILKSNQLAEDRHTCAGGVMHRSPNCWGHGIHGLRPWFHDSYLVDVDNIRKEIKKRKKLRLIF